MEMRPVVLREADGNEIPVRTAPSGRKILFESAEAAAFLRHVTLGDGRSLPPRALLRGVIVPDEGAFVEVYDSFGRVEEHFLRWDDERTRQLVMELR